MVTDRPETPLAIRPSPAQLTRRAPQGRLALSADRRRRAAGALVSFGFHAALLGWIAWGGSQLVAAANRRPGGLGLRGGGGGGGASRVVFFQLPEVAPPMEVAMVPPPAEVVVALKPPTDLPEIEIEMPKFDIPASSVTVVTTGSVLGQGPGTGGGPGAGTGTGGGIGSGRGTGIGDSIGPGTGGDGGRILPPVPRQVIIPPMGAPGSLKGKEVVVTFWIDTDGRVTRVETRPAMSRGDYARIFREVMLGYRFTPALTFEGQPVAAKYEVKFFLPSS